MTDTGLSQRGSGIEHVLGASLEDLSIEEIVGVLLAPADRLSATVPRARELLAAGGGLRRLARMSPREILEHAEPEVAARLACAVELGRRERRAPLPSRRVVRGLSDIDPHLRGLLSGRLKEMFVVVLLDAKNRPLRTERVSEGCLTWSVVHPREVFAPAVRDSAGAVIVAHNHPSGDPMPSAQDLEVTRRLLKAGETLGVPLLDHVIVGAERSLSMRAQGFLDPG